MRDLFIADAHLRSPDDLNYQTLLTFLESQSTGLRTLYLLGDIFEFWLGFEHVAYADHIPALDCFRRLHDQGVNIVYVEGNHDFNLGPFFEQRLNCKILPNGGEVRIDDNRVYLAHGDLADPSDRGYRLLRRFFRSGLIRFLSGIVHPDKIWKFAGWASRNSAGKRNRSGRNDCRPLLLAYAERLFETGCEYVLTGHYHTPFIEKTAAGTLIALGDWIEQFSYAVYEQGEFRLERYQPETPG